MPLSIFIFSLLMALVVMVVWLVDQGMPMVLVAFIGVAGGAGVGALEHWLGRDK